MKNVILVGMPACGKSTIGVVLAKTMNKGFVDTDILIQQAENRPCRKSSTKRETIISTTSKSGSSWTLMEKTMW